MSFDKSPRSPWFPWFFNLSVATISPLFAQVCRSSATLLPNPSFEEKTPGRAGPAEQREEQTQRPAADDGRHQEAVRFVVPQHAGRGERDVRQVRDDVPCVEGQQARIGRVRLVPGLERHVPRRRERVRVEHEALHRGRGQGPGRAEPAVRDCRDGAERLEAGWRRDADGPRGADVDERRAGIQGQREGVPHRRPGGQGGRGPMRRLAKAH